MARQPIVGGDIGAWGSILNNYLSVSLNADGTLKSSTAAVTTINVTDPTYGAVGDGSTNNTAAIQSAINAMGANGGSIYFPPGTYRHTGTITWPNKHFMAIGAGSGNTILEYTGAGTAHSISSDGSTFTNIFRDMMISSTASTGVVCNFIKPGWLMMKGMEIVANGGTPTDLLKISGDLAAAQFTHLENVFTRGNLVATRGITLSGSALPGVTASKMISCRTFQCVTGIFLENMEGLNMFGTACEAGTNGIVIDGGRYINLHGGHFESNTAVDVQIKSTAISTLAITISGAIDWATSAPVRNIDVQTPGVSTNDVKILHQRFQGAATSENIRFQAGVTDCTVAYCGFSNATEITDASTRLTRWANRKASGAYEYIIPSGPLTQSSAQRHTWLLNSGAFSNDLSIRSSTSDDLVYGVPTASGTHVFQWAGADKCWLEDQSGGAGLHFFTESSADHLAPAANGAVLYTRDSGGGKTQLVVRFNTGAIQILATEP